MKKYGKQITAICARGFLQGFENWVFFCLFKERPYFSSQEDALMIGGTQHNERWRGKEFSSSFVTLSFILDWKKLISEGKVCPGRWEECRRNGCPLHILLCLCILGTARRKKV